MVRLVLLVGILVAACGGHPTTVVVGDFPHRDTATVKSGDPSGMTLDAGRYRVTWSGSGCTFVDIEWAPTNDSPEIVIAKDAAANRHADPGMTERVGTLHQPVTTTRRVCRRHRSRRQTYRVPTRCGNGGQPVGR